MVYKKIQNEQGDYKDKQEVRFTVLEAHEAHTPEGLNIGWDVFKDMDEALAEYGLIFDPLPEQVEVYE